MNRHFIHTMFCFIYCKYARIGVRPNLCVAATSTTTPW
jgi:hypothetical protein